MPDSDPAQKKDAVVPNAAVPVTETSTAVPASPKSGIEQDSATKETDTINRETSDIVEKGAETTSVVPAVEGSASAELHEDEASAEIKDASETKEAEAQDNMAKASRRKSGVPVGKGKMLAKKASKARLTHLDANPGDHYFVKLKGYPPWPVIIADEEMLPTQLLKNRPVSAMRPDGAYRDDYADSGRRAHDRSYPVMYLQTNEFSWVRNTDLEDLDFDTVKDRIVEKMRKDLQVAHELAAEHHSLDHYKQILIDFDAEQQEKQRAAAAKQLKITTKAASKRKESEDSDEKMDDAADAEHSSSTSAKKRKAEDSTGLQPSGSIKKPKIKLTSTATPKTNKSNGLGSAKSTSKPTPKRQGIPKSKIKTKKVDGPAPKSVVTFKDDLDSPNLTLEQSFERKKRHVLFIRHQIQKTFITSPRDPTEEDARAMSEHMTELEEIGGDLEAEVIRFSKVNKVHKALLRLDTVPFNDQFNFRARAEGLLFQWGKILSKDPTGSNAAGEVPDSPTEKKAAGSNGVKIVVPKTELMDGPENSDAKDAKDVAMPDAEEEETKHGASAAEPVAS